MFIALRLCPWSCKLLGSRQGLSTEVGFIQVCVQNDAASSTTYYNTLSHSGLYRGHTVEERTIREIDGRKKKKDKGAGTKAKEQQGEENRRKGHTTTKNILCIDVVTRDSIDGF